MTAAGPFQDRDVSLGMVKGRSMLRLAQRVASVVSCRPARWRASTARFLRWPWPVARSGCDGGVVFAVDGVRQPSGRLGTSPGV